LLKPATDAEWLKQVTVEAAGERKGIMRTTVGRARSRRLLAAALGAAAVLALSVAPASGHKRGYDTNLQLKIDSLTPTSTQYSGKVTSEKGACRPNRLITVTTAGIAIATTFSDAAANWTVVVNGTPPPKGQDVIASTPKKFLKRNKKHRHKCRAASVTHKAP
jgi:hypothetical protein